MTGHQFGPVCGTNLRWSDRKFRQSDLSTAITNVSHAVWLRDKRGQMPSKYLNCEGGFAYTTIAQDHQFV